MIRNRFNKKYNQQKLQAFSKSKSKYTSNQNLTSSNKKIEVKINIIKETQKNEIELPVRMHGTRQQSISSNGTESSYEQKRLLKHPSQQRYSNLQLEDQFDDEQDYDDVYELETQALNQPQRQVWVDRKAAQSPPRAKFTQQQHNDLKKFLDNASLSSANTDSNNLKAINNPNYVRNDSYYNANRQPPRPNQAQSYNKQPPKKTIGQVPKEQQQIPTTQDYASYEITV